MDKGRVNRYQLFTIIVCKFLSFYSCRPREERVCEGGGGGGGEEGGGKKEERRKKVK